MRPGKFVAHHECHNCEQVRMLPHPTSLGAFDGGPEKHVRPGKFVAHHECHDCEQVRMLPHWTRPDWTRLDWRFCAKDLNLDVTLDESLTAVFRFSRGGHRILWLKEEQTTVTVKKTGRQSTTSNMPMKARLPADLPPPLRVCVLCVCVCVCVCVCAE